MASFRRKTTATRIVTAALIEHLDKLDAEDAIPLTAKKTAPATKVEVTKAAAVIAADDSDGLSVDSRAGGWHPEVEAEGQTFVVELPVPDPKPLSAKVSGPLPWTRVDTPEEAAKVAAYVPSFNPVPKPGKKAAR